jgi:hypothetical protein
LTGGQIWTQPPLQFDLVLVSGANQYRVKPSALVSTITPLICVVFKAGPEEAGLEDVPLVPPEPELPHAAANNAAATKTISASNLFRIDVSLHQDRPPGFTGPAAACHASAGMTAELSSVPPIDRTPIPHLAGRPTASCATPHTL